MCQHECHPVLVPQERMQDLSIPLSPLWLSAHSANFSAGDHSWTEGRIHQVSQGSARCVRRSSVLRDSSASTSGPSTLGQILSVLVGCEHLAMLGFSHNLSLNKMQGETFQCVLNKVGKWKQKTTGMFCHLVHVFQKGQSWLALGLTPPDAKLGEAS